MGEQKINEALKYVKATNEIEDIKFRAEELKKIKEALEKNKSDKSFLMNVVEQVKEYQNGKVK